MEESFEDILEESKRTQRNNRINSVNKKLWIAIGICSLIVAIGWPMLIPFPGYDLSSKIAFGIMAVVLSLPMLSGMFALPISLVPMYDWDYGTRFYRVFLIVLLFWDGLMALFVAIMAIVELIKVF